MTYCLAIKVDEGICFAGDTRSNAGADYVTSCRKLHAFETAPDRAFLLQVAGNLATTQEICNWIRRDLLATDGRESLNTVQYMFEAADYVGRISRAIVDRHAAALASSGVSGESSLILGGQIAGQEHQILLIYPQGNCIEATTDTPYLQIGENKYGKPMVDRLVSTSISLEQATRLALISLDATIRSNATVASPVDLAIYRAGTQQQPIFSRLGDTDPYLINLRKSWNENLRSSFDALEAFDWETMQEQPG